MANKEPSTQREGQFTTEGELGQGVTRAGTACSGK